MFGTVILFLKSIAKPDRTRRTWSWAAVVSSSWRICRSTRAFTSAVILDGRPDPGVRTMVPVILYLHLDLSANSTSACSHTHERNARVNCSTTVVQPFHNRFLTVPQPFLKRTVSEAF